MRIPGNQFDKFLFLLFDYWESHFLSLSLCIPYNDDFKLCTVKTNCKIILFLQIGRTGNDITYANAVDVVSVFVFVKRDDIMLPASFKLDIRVCSCKEFYIF